MQPTNTAAPRNDLFDVITVYNPSEEPFEVKYNDQLQAVIQPGMAVQLVKLVAGDAENGNIKHLIDRMCKLNGKTKNDPATRAAWAAKVIVNQNVNHAPVLTTLEQQAIEMNKRLSDTPLDVPQASLPTTPVTPTTLPVTPVDPQWKFDPQTGKPLVQRPPVLITPDQVDTSHIQIQPAQATLPPAAASALPGAVPPAALIHPDPATNSILAGIRGGDANDDGRIIGEVPAVEEPATPDAPNRTENPTREDLVAYARDVVMMDINEATTKLMLETQDVETLKKTLNYDIYA